MLRKFFGGLLMAVGGLLVVSSGLCTLVFVGATLWPHSGMGVGMIPLELLIGGVPGAVGLGVFFAGRAVYRGWPRMRP